MKKTVRFISIVMCCALCLGISGCTGKSSFCVKVGKQSVSAGMYAYQLQSQKSSYLSGNSLTETDGIWDEEYDDDYTIGEYLQTTVLNSLTATCLWRNQFEKLGLTFSQDEQKAIDDSIDKMLEGIGGKDALVEQLKTYGISYEEYIDSVYYDTQKIMKVVDYYYGEKGIDPVPENDIKQYFEDNYVRTKSILISTCDDDGTTITGSDMQAAKEKAQSVYEQAKNASEADFEKLMDKYNEDEGAAGYPDGYVFTTGEMDSDFEKTSFDMEVNETRMVKSQYGFHVIRKLTLDAKNIFTDEVRKNLLVNMKAGDLQKMLSEWKDENTVKVNNSVLRKYTCNTVAITGTETSEQKNMTDQIAGELGLTEEDKVEK